MTTCVNGSSRLWWPSHRVFITEWWNVLTSQVPLAGRGIPDTQAMGPQVGTAAHQVVPATLPNTDCTFGSAGDTLAFRQQTYKNCRWHLPLCRGLPGKCHPPPTPTLGINFVSFHCCSSGVCGAQHGQLSLSELPAQHICTSAPGSGEKER